MDSDPQGRSRSWTTRKEEKARRLARVQPWIHGRLLDTDKIVEALQNLISPGDRVALEGNNQKQADFLSRALARTDPAIIHDIHLLISSVSRAEHLDLFQKGIARKIDFAYAGPQSLRIAQLLEDGQIELGAIHTYVELYARMFVDLNPRVALVCAEQGDAQGNLYTGPNTEDTPVIVEATAFRHGIVIAQVNSLAAACRYTRLLGRFNCHSRSALRDRTAFYPRSAPHQRTPCAHGNDGHPRGL